MNGKIFKFGITIILFAVIFIFGGCQQPIETGDKSRDGAFEKNSLLIEVWDSSTPPKFLGYDTGLGNYRDRPIIFTSKGYCVELQEVRYYNYLDYLDEYGEPAREIKSKIRYCLGADTDHLPDEERNDIVKNNSWGSAVFFATANPTANDTLYAMWGSSIDNYVMYNPHNSGTYYTVDRDKTRPSNITIQGNFKSYDTMGTMRTLNDDFFLQRGMTSKDLIGEPFDFVPLKKIGGYAELGLPNPVTTTYPLVYKVR